MSLPQRAVSNYAFNFAAAASGLEGGRQRRAEHCSEAACSGEALAQESAAGRHLLRHKLQRSTYVFLMGRCLPSFAKPALLAKQLLPAAVGTLLVPEKRCLPSFKRLQDGSGVSIPAPVPGLGAAATG